MFLDRLIKANPNAFVEAINMFTEGVRDIFLEGAERYGWLNERDNNREIERLKAVAKKLLLRGLTVDDVAEDTGLTIEIVDAIANQVD